ncbi:MAG: glycosyltransferase family 2 protein, partial [bacterium]|nr:glycosyltransferase family 2 protein [bacterium]
NGSSDGSVVLAQKFPFVKVINESKRGISYARNAGFNAAKGDIIGRIDADTRLPETWVERVTSYLSEHPGKLLTGGSYFYDLALPSFFGWVQGQVAFRANLFILGHYIAWGSNMAFGKHLWQSVKDEVHNDTTIHEDIDLGMHLHDKGVKIHYDPSLKVGVDSRLTSNKRSTRSDHMKYLIMWPRTLEKHGLKRAWLGWVGVYMVYFSYTPMLIAHSLARFDSYLRRIITVKLG